MDAAFIVIVGTNGDPGVPFYPRNSSGGAAPKFDFPPREPAAVSGHETFIIRRRVSYLIIRHRRRGIFPNRAAPPPPWNLIVVIAVALILARE